MKLTVLKNKVKESLDAAYDKATELDNACKLAKVNKEFLSYEKVSSFTEFSTSVANVVALECKLQEAISNFEEAKSNYHSEVLRLISNTKKCLILSVIGCAAITFLIAGLL